MRKHEYSQLPVTDKGKVLGVFSFRSFAIQTSGYTLEMLVRDRCAPRDLRVDDFLEEFDFVRVTEEISRLFDPLDRDNGVLVGTPEQLIGVVTPVDLLRYYYEVASPFVMVSEIELAVRALISRVLNADLAAAAKRSLASAYGGPELVPTSLEAMTFDNYQSLITYGENWPAFEPLLGATRTRTRGKLKEVGAIRNDLFHFKREITEPDRETLADYRNWLLTKIKQAELGPTKEMKP
jgi:hypothetical protein